MFRLVFPGRRKDGGSRQMKRCGRTKCGKWVFLAILLILAGGIGAGITWML